MKNSLEIILNEPSYWVEGINGMLYNAIVEYMEKNRLNRTQLAEVLGISKGRVSQILNDGDINFSIEKIVDISIKVGKYPVFELEDAHIYLKRIQDKIKLKSLVISDINTYSTHAFIGNQMPSSSQTFRTKNTLKIA